jgi:hypothetical protein
LAVQARKEKGVPGRWKNMIVKYNIRAAEPVGIPATAALAEVVFSPPLPAI